MDTIIWLAEAEEKDKVVGLVTSLSRFFRTSLNEGKDNITIEEELRHARSYLEIQQVRYQDILDYEIDVPAELYPYRIPKITLQPLVENALYHGIKNRRGKGTIRVTGEKREDCLCLMVSDDGIGIPPERLSQIRKRINEPEASDMGIYGLYNVNQRIRLRAGEGYGLQIDSRYEEGTVVTVRLPLVTEYLTDSKEN